MTDGGELVEAPVEAPAGDSTTAARGREMSFAEVKALCAGVRPHDRRVPLMATVGWIQDYIGVTPQMLYFLVRQGRVAWATVGAKKKLYCVPDVLEVVREQREWRRSRGLDKDLEWIEAQLKREEEMPWDGSGSAE